MFLESPLLLCPPSGLLLKHLKKFDFCPWRPGLQLARLFVCVVNDIFGGPFKNNPRNNQEPLNGGGGQTGGFPIWTRPSFCCPFFGTFPIFPDFFADLLGDAPGFSRFVPFLFLGLLRAPTRKSPKRVRDTIWTFPEKSGKRPGLETPGLASL